MWKIKELTKKKKIVIASITAVVVVAGAVLGAYFYVRQSYNNIVVTDPPKVEQETEVPIPEEAQKIEEIDYGMESDIVNILLVGVDTRGEFDDSRTDSMIIATVDPTTNKVKLTSLMRDMYVEIPGKGYNKLNTAFEIGGIDLLEKTIKYNFGLAIDKYVAIDFKGFQDLIDLVGGIDVEIKDYEVKETNKYIQEVNGTNSTLLQGPGLQRLNGQQALSYSRIRKVGNNDYERTERQRRVLSVLLGKLKDTKVTSYPKLYSTISPYIRTNIDFSSMLKLVYTVYKMNDYTPGSFRIPVDNHFKDTDVKGMAVLIPDLKYNAKELFKFIYNKVPDNLTVANNSKVYNADANVEKKTSTQTPTTPAAEQPAATNPTTTNPGTGTGTTGTGTTGTDTTDKGTGSNGGAGTGNTGNGNGGATTNPTPPPATNTGSGTDNTTNTANGASTTTTPKS